MSKKVAALVVFVLFSVLLVASISGCVNFSNPLGASNTDHSATFAKSIESIGWTPINPISMLSDNVYSGSYRSTGDQNGTKFTFEITIEIAQSETAAKERYGKLILAKQSEGYTSRSSGIAAGATTIYGDTKASWFGYKFNSLISASTYSFMYAYNTEIGKWVVITEFGDTFSGYGTPTPIAWTTTTVP